MERQLRKWTWCAQIRKDGKAIHLGYFPPTDDGEIDAATVYNFKAEELFGEFARFNVPLEGK